MPVDNEINALVDLVAGGILAGDKPVGADAMLAKTAGMQAGVTLVKLILSDIKRAADALEVLARLKLAEDKNTLFEPRKDK